MSNIIILNNDDLNKKVKYEEHILMVNSEKYREGMCEGIIKESTVIFLEYF